MRTNLLLLCLIVSVNLSGQTNIQIRTSIDFDVPAIKHLGISSDLEVESRISNSLGIFISKDFGRILVGTGINYDLVRTYVNRSSWISFPVSNYNYRKVGIPLEVTTNISDIFLARLFSSLDNRKFMNSAGIHETEGFNNQNKVSFDLGFAMGVNINSKLQLEIGIDKELTKRFVVFEQRDDGVQIPRISGYITTLFLGIRYQVNE